MSCLKLRKNWLLLNKLAFNLDNFLSEQCSLFFLRDYDHKSSYFLNNPLICLGDGHSGVWNLFSRIAKTQQRYEILDWFHLKENLLKVGGSLKRLRQVETFLS
jgi:hypothetical protein